MADIAVGTYVGNDISGHAITGVGFQPVSVWVLSWDGSLSGGDTYRAIVVGCGTAWQNGSFQNVGWSQGALFAVQRTDAVLSLDADGFTVGGFKWVNEAAKEFVYIAFKDAPSFLDAFAYTGNGADPQTVGLSMTPDWLAVFGGAGATPVRAWKPALHAPGDGVALNEFGGAIDVSSDFNQSGQLFFGFALKKRSLTVEVASYTGDGGASKDIVHPNSAFQPIAVMANSFTPSLYITTQGKVPQAILPENVNQAPVSTAITAFNADGFRVGTALNGASNTYEYLSLGVGSLGGNLVQAAALPVDAGGQSSLGPDAPSHVEAGGQASLGPDAFLGAEAQGFGAVSAEAMTAIDTLLALVWTHELPVELTYSPFLAQAWKEILQLVAPLPQVWNQVGGPSQFGLDQSWVEFTETNGLAHFWRELPAKLVELYDRDVQVAAGDVSVS